MSIFNRAIEPIQHSLDLYKAALANLPKELHNTKITFDMDQPKTFQEYMMEGKKTVQFDIVHFIHSLYYIDVEKALTHCYENELGEKGLIICVLVVEDDIMYCIQQKQLDKSQNCPALEKGKEVLKVADKNSWKYQEHIQEFYFDVTEIFDEKSVEGNLLLDFLVVTFDFRSNTSQKNVEQYLDLIRKKCVIRDGKYLAKKSSFLLNARLEKCNLVVVVVFGLKSPTGFYSACALCRPLSILVPRAPRFRSSPEMALIAAI
ncbi:hypothetical protein QZH41_001503 [Actinostola sp. cb2023]|nr:hypothetical protein QZH41_001503 [Actinostola sp. cb2023]